MAVQIKIDQAGRPPGVAGVAREDIATGTPVTLTAVGGPFSAYRWSLVTEPVDVDTDAVSAAAPTAPTSSTTLLSPIDVAATYLVDLAVDSGFGLGAREEDVARLTFYAGPSLATVMGDLPERVPATGERAEHNAGGNLEGWARALRRWFRVIKAISQGRAWAACRVVHDPILGPSVLRGLNVAGSGVTYDSGTGEHVIAFTRAMADANYAVFAMPIYNASFPNVTIPRAQSFLSGSCRVAFFQVDGTTKIRQSFAFLAILRA